MLYVSLIGSAVLLILAVLAARPAPHPVVWDRFLVGGAVVTLTPCVAVIFPATAATFAALAAALAVWPLARRRVRSFLPLAGVAVAAAYAGVIVLWVVSEFGEYDRLRSLYPLESMEDRVPAPAGPMARPAPTDVGLDVAVENEERRAHRRNRAIEKLHAGTTAVFVDSFGFGVGRMSDVMVRPAEHRLKP